MQAFDDLILQIRHAAEMAEAVVREIHTRIESLLRVGYFVDTIFLGEKIWQKPASDFAECDDLGTVYQPSLWTHQGFGVVVWDAAEFLKLRDEFRLEAEARVFFKQFYACNDFEKSLILGNHGELLNALKNRFSI